MTRMLVMSVFATAAGVLAQPEPTPAAPAAPTTSVQPSGDGAFAKRLEGVDAAMAKVVDLRADFEQRRKTPLLKKPLVSKGTVVTKGDRVRWDTVSPRASAMVIGGGELRLYYPADKVVEVYPVADAFKDLASSPLPRLSALKGQFELAALPVKELGGDEKNDKLIAVSMTPKGDDLRKHVVVVKVLIDVSKPAAVKVVTTDPEGEETEILFTNVRLNGSVRDDEVELKLPEGVRVSRPMGEGKAASPKTEPEKKP